MVYLDEVMEQLFADLRSLVEVAIARRNAREWARLVLQLREGHTYDPRVNRTGS